MRHRISSLRRTLHPVSSFPPHMGTLRAAPFLLQFNSTIISQIKYSSRYSCELSFPLFRALSSSSVANSVNFGLGVRNGTRRPFARVFADSERSYGKQRLIPPKKDDKNLQLSVGIIIEDELPDDPEIENIAELLRHDAPMAMKLAFEGLIASEYKTRETTISDLDEYDNVELSVVLCNDKFIRELNKEWMDEDYATDVLSISHHIPEIKIPILMFGDVVISVETAARQAAERSHTLLDEIHILMVHGLLHLLGFDHEISEDAEAEMEKEEERLLEGLGWKAKGLIKSACEEAENGGYLHSVDQDDRKKEGSLRFYKPKFQYIFCDMDGTLLNSKSQITTTTANALREALSRNVKFVIATGKTRPAVVSALKMVDLAGKDGIVSESSPGVFLQGLLIYGRQGQEIFRRNLNLNICREALSYSLKHKIPLVVFSGDRCLSLFDHPLIDSLHTKYHEPKAEILTSIENMLAVPDIQKLLFLDTAEAVGRDLKQYWSKAVGDDGAVTQALPDMLEIVPYGTSKGGGVELLLHHLGVNANQVMAIGDGENDVEMLKLASLGVALSNGSEKTKTAADVIGMSNDEDGVADAIYRYAF